MQILDNVNKTVRDDLAATAERGGKLSIAAACFSMYAYQALKKQLDGISELRFIFTSPAFLQEKPPKEKREFYIPRLDRERSLYGTEFEVRLRNDLTQKAIARECADWIRKKVKFRANFTNGVINTFLDVQQGDGGFSYTPMNGFTTADLGIERGNNIAAPVIKFAHSEGSQFLELFNMIWNDKKLLADVTDQVIDGISAAYIENAPEFLYFVALYNIFNEFLSDINEDFLPNEASGFKNSVIWGKLYDFQKDAAQAIINKLERYNGCILADSVGLGKTYTALSVIQYYGLRNKNVLVLCPKKLGDNWTMFNSNVKNNPLLADRLSYDVLYHTDLSRAGGFSNGHDLSKWNWDNYDLVVIDESHNFRNGGEMYTGGDDDRRENRYMRLMNKVIRKGVKTKVLMLSATPVNNGFSDLRHQLELAYEGNPNLINDKLKESGVTKPINQIFKNAQKAFNAWSKLPPEERSTDGLLRSLDFDFFTMLDSVTIARSRKHIEKYYDMDAIGHFPERLPPIPLRPPLTDIKGAVNYLDLEYRRAQLVKLQNEVVDLEDMQSGISIMDLGLNEFRMDLLEYVKHNGDMEKVPLGLHAVVGGDTPNGTIFVLKNLYIEGDNLDVLKLLQESYLGKVKMIYIDPPYNTGHDFIYNDNFRSDDEEYAYDTDLYDRDGCKQFRENTDANPRFHSDWCSMIYPRLSLARNLLSDDGVIFISIDDNEVAQLRKICDEVFGERLTLSIGFDKNARLLEVIFHVLSDEHIVVFHAMPCRKYYIDRMMS